MTAVPSTVPAALVLADHTSTLERLVTARVLSVFDRELALALGELGRERNPAVPLAAAFASAAVQAGHTCVDLGQVAERRFTDEEGAVVDVALPERGAWLAALRESDLVTSPATATHAPKPLVLDAAGRLYLFRYFEYERRLATGLLSRQEPAESVEAIDREALGASLLRLFPPADARGALQRVAALVFLRQRLTVISGGPGTGKTYTVAKALALLQEQALARGRAPYRVLLTAPTGKAAQRLGDAIRENLEKFGLDAERLGIPVQASTLHRALGYQRQKPTTFRRNASRPLPDDVVVVDEASMVDLATMAKLVDAVRPDARLLLLGDKDQLASVEAGAILADIYAGSSDGVSGALAAELASLGDAKLPVSSARPSRGLHDGLVHLTESHRFDDDGGIAALARAVNAGDAARALEVLARGGSVALAEVGTVNELEQALGPVVVTRLGALAEGDVAERLKGLDRFRVLAAHRRGRLGVEGLNVFVADELARAGRLEPRGAYYDGRPLIVAANAYDLGLFNGDVGLLARAASAADAPLRAWFRGDRPGTLRDFSPARLPRHDTAFALSVHKSQGSEFAEVAFVLPERPSRVVTRELVYTAITRARAKVTIFGSESVLRQAIATRVERASGLAEKLWSSGGEPRE